MYDQDGLLKKKVNLAFLVGFYPDSDPTIFFTPDPDQDHIFNTDPAMF